MILYILLYSFLAITAINCVYYLLFIRFAFKKHPNCEKNVNTPVSVIVYSKNEQEKLKGFLQQFEKQTHVNYELILINNASSDDTRYIFEDYQRTHPNVSIVNVVNNENFWGSRKYALTLGIKKAKFENLLFTTVASHFESKNWITENIGLFGGANQIVLGHSYFNNKKGFLNHLVRFSELMSNIQNYGWGSVFKPYQGSQHNFGYAKSLFFQSNGFSDHMSIFQGAEDLFLKRNATFKNVILATNTNSLVKKEAPNSLSQWINYKVAQKKISKHYKFVNKLNIKLFSFSQFVFFVLAILACVFFPSGIVYGVIAFRYLLAGAVMVKSAIKLHDSKVIYFFPFMEIVNSIMQFPIFISKLFSK